MRKRIKKKIADIFQLLAEMQQQAWMLLGSGRRTEALEMLRQCQLYTLKAGEWIEESEGMGTEAVACLEEYCDQLYQMSQWEESSEGEKDGKGAKPENSKKRSEEHTSELQSPA